jgi:hypothetical protein
MAGFPPKPRFFEFTLAVNESLAVSALMAAMYCLSLSEFPVGLWVLAGKGDSFGAVPCGT